MSVDPKTQSLFEAIAAVNTDRVKLAIDSGAAINSPNDRGQTPLALACRQGSLEIVDLLVAAGAQMHPKSDSNAAWTGSDRLGVSNSSMSARSTQPSVLPVSGEPELLPAPANVREIQFENLIELIHQPIDSSATQIEQIMPSESPQLPSKNPTVALRQMTANWQNASSDPDDEATYTFDLDEVFAANERLDRSSNMASAQILTPDPSANSLPESIDGTVFESDETYAFDLSLDLDRLTLAATEDADRLAVPMGAWGENETYVVDNFEQLLPDINPISVEQAHEPIEAKIAQIDRLFEVEEDRFVPERGWEEGETYAIDLDNFCPAETQIDTDLDLASDRHLLSDLDSSLFPVVGGEDEPDYDDPDTQTTTDIFGHSGIQPENKAPLVPVYEENATNTSLMAAAIDGDLDLVQQAIEAGANLDRYDWNLGYSPLGMAIDRGYPELVQCLLAAGANPHSGSTSTTALGLAVERGESEIVQMLLPRGVDVNAPVGRDGWTALLAAIKNGHRAVVQLLVTAGANVNAWSRGETPILLAAKCEEREIYQYLYPLVNTAIRLCADRDGEQLLQATGKRRIRAQNRPVEKFIEMATVGNIDEVNRAIEVGIEIDEIGAKGHTALMAAAYHGHRSIVNILLAAGADPNLLSDDDGLGTAGMTALMLAAGSFFASNRHQIVKLLIAGGADVNQRGAGGKTAIFYAALAGSGYVDCVEATIANGADLHLQDDLGHTVLSAVAAAENYGMFNLLMQAGAPTAGLESIQLIQAAGAGNVERVKSLLASNVNLDLDRGAAIGNAVAAGHTQIVELLIQAGANVNLRDKLGFTPIATAAYAGYGQIVQLLIDAGADTQAPAGESQSYSALEYAQMGLYQFPQENLQHAQIVRVLQQLGAR
jgi:ankyrin repeat protein